VIRRTDRKLRVAHPRFCFPANTKPSPAIVASHARGSPAIAKGTSVRHRNLRVDTSICTFQELFVGDVADWIASGRGERGLQTNDAPLPSDHSRLTSATVLAPHATPWMRHAARDARRRWLRPAASRASRSSLAVLVNQKRNGCVSSIDGCP
jgi:hypothetical protein